MLVVRGEDAGVDDGAEGDGEAFIDGLCGEDTGGADFVGELAGLVEDEGEDVLVVGDGDDGLDYELTVAHDGGAPGAVVGVLPPDAAVLLVDADYVVHGQGLAGGVVQDRADIVDGAEAVASELEVVCHDTGSGIAKIEGRLLVIGVAGVGVWDVHVGERQSVEEGAAVIVDVIENHAFSQVEANLEVPLLPVNGTAEVREVADGERSTLWLNNIQWLEVGAESLSLVNILIGWLHLVWAKLLNRGICSSG